MNYNDLSDEQQELIDRARRGENILVDACIGSGKTTTIQVLCNELSDKRILYLTYNRLLKIDAQEKITSKNVLVTNYHGYAWKMLQVKGISVGQADLIQTFNRVKPFLFNFDLLVLDEYQDIEQELAEMLDIIKEQNPNMQIIAVGDMKQKIYDKTTLSVPPYIKKFLGDYTLLQFTKCFRLSKDHAEMLGRIWDKQIKGVNPNCEIEIMDFFDAIHYIAKQNPSDLLCLGARTGPMPRALNILEEKYPTKFNKRTVFANIRDDNGSVNPNGETAIFTTYDSSKGLERKICVIFNFTESYWHIRLNKPMVKYDILKNIFCVAASRGKEKIIFVKDWDFNNKKPQKILSEKTISTPSEIKKEFYRPFDMSEMFDFKYKEDIEECYGFLKIKKKRRSDKTTIYIKNNDDMIDLSPCIGIYQEANFFKNYNIDQEIKFAESLHDDRPPINLKSDAKIDDKILCLTAYCTCYDRYVTQVESPFVTKEQADSINERLRSIFDSEEQVQVDCAIDFKFGNSSCSMKGRADVVKDKAVYELKFVQELNHTHFLQCACYMIAMGLKKGFLWNVQNNEMYEIAIPDKDKFLDAVVKTITKGVVKEFQKVG